MFHKINCAASLSFRTCTVVFNIVWNLWKNIPHIISILYQQIVLLKCRGILWLQLLPLDDILLELCLKIMKKWRFWQEFHCVHLFLSLFPQSLLSGKFCRIQRQCFIIRIIENISCDFKVSFCYIYCILFLFNNFFTSFRAYCTIIRSRTICRDFLTSLVSDSFFTLFWIDSLLSLAASFFLNCLVLSLAKIWRTSVSL